MTNKRETNVRTGMEIAVIGMAGKFPGAKNLEELWNNLKNGVESISYFSDEELEKEGDIIREILTKPGYIKAHGYFEGKEIFDTSFFGYSHWEAELMEPQIRLFHECVWEALEDAGYIADSYDGNIGLYAGAVNNFNWQAISHLTGKIEDHGIFTANQLTDKDYLCSRVSYNLNLKGASSFVQTACSTSLVAIHHACRALLTGESEIALAGGISISPKFKHGYMYREGMILSSDGHCRAFDAKANGTVIGEGLGIVVLRRLRPAIENRDHIYAMIRGTAINNDGRRKMGFTAPSIEGQAEVIRTAQRMARIEAESITYIETHGTGTTLGDPAEIEALKLAFNTGEKNYCAIGSIKTNFGHLDAAAGVAGFIKTVLSLQHKLIPPNLHFETPNPKTDFENSPFYVNTTLKKWESNGYPRRAGVSSFGIGGTNAHVVIEETPQDTRGVTADPSKGKKLLLLSAKTTRTLDKASGNIGEYLAKNPNINLADVAYTLQVGRKPFQHRRMLICVDTQEAITALTTPNSSKMKTFHQEGEKEKRVIYMFPGQGSQYVNMGRELYEKEPLFRNQMDRCFEILHPLIGYNIKEILYPGSLVSKESSSLSHKSYSSNMSNTSNMSYKNINQTGIAQSLIFIFEYSLAVLLLEWGITPHGMIGHSIGEYVSACLAGVFSLEHALKLVVTRGKSMQRMPPGAMLTIAITEEALIPLLENHKHISVAAINGPTSCVVSGPFEAIDAFEKQVKTHGHETSRLHTSHAFHSRMMAPILKEFEDAARSISLHEPRLPYISNVTGKWITAEQAVNPRYWALHLRKTVRFADGVTEILKKGRCIFIEIGAGKTLSTLVRQNDNKETRCINLVRHPKEEISDNDYLLDAIGQLWLYGKGIDWKKFHAGEKRYRVSLPTYPFEGNSYWFDAGVLKTGLEKFIKTSPTARKPDAADWFYTPLWQQSIPYRHRFTGSLNWLLFMNETKLAHRLGELLVQNGQHVIKVKTGDRFTPATNTDASYTVNPRQPGDYDKLFSELYRLKRIPQKIIHLWSATGQDTGRPGLEELDKFLDTGFFSLLNIVRVLGRLNITDPIALEALTDNMKKVTGQERLFPEKAVLLGAMKIIPLEYPNITCRCIDILPPEPGSGSNPGSELLHLLLGEFTSNSKDKYVAYRGNQRWIEIYKPLRLEKNGSAGKPFKEKGVYLILGGFGGMGFTIAEHLAKSFKAGLILVGRSVFPPREKWDQWLKTHDPQDGTTVKIKKIREWEAQGAEIMVFGADVSNLEQMQEVISRAIHRFRQINGIIHAAGMADFGGAIQKRTREITSQNMASKIKGTLILEQLTKNIPLDFMVLFSSVGNVLYSTKFGQVSYNAANEFLEAFADYRSTHNHPLTLTINWGDWKEVGMSVMAFKKQYHDKDEKPDWESHFYDALSPAEGIDVFTRAVERRLHRVTISTIDLEVKIREQEAYLEKAVGESSLEKIEKIKDTQGSYLYKRPELSTPYAAPRNQTEVLLVDIFQRLSGIENIGIHDNFFELGGDSLKAMTVIANIKKKLNINIPLALFFNSPTIEEIALYIMNTKMSKFYSIEPVEKKECYPLSSAQKRLYFLYCMERDSTDYNQPQILTLSGKCNIKRLEEAACKLIERHESLRTSFAMLDDIPIQKIDNAAALKLTYSNANRQEEVEAYLADFIKPFDLGKPPLVRLQIIKIGEEKYMLMQDIHHIVSDGMSNVLFRNELTGFYQGEELPPLRLQYKDFSEWRNSEREKVKIQRQEAYWLEVFQGEIPVLKLPYDYSRPMVKGIEGSSVTFEINKEQAVKLKGIAYNEGTSLFMVLLAVFNILLSKMSGQEDVVLGVPAVGRRHPDITKIIGMFVNTLALRNLPSAGKTFTAFLSEVKEKTLKALENQDYQFEDIVEKVKAKRDMSRNPLFDVMFIFEDVTGVQVRGANSLPPGKTGTMKIEPYLYEWNNSKFDISLSAAEKREKLLFTLEYSTQLFRKKTIQKLTGYFQQLVTGITANPHEKLADIDMISKETRDKMVDYFNENLRETFEIKPVQARLSEAFKKYRENIALQCASTQVTYKELQHRSACISKWIAHHNIAKGSFIGIYCKNKIDIISAIIGTLDRACIFVPLDTALPYKRIENMIALAKVPVILTDPAGKTVLSNMKERNRHIDHIFTCDESFYRGHPLTGNKNHDIPYEKEDKVYIYFTSGSTGVPNAIVGKNESLAQFLEWEIETFSIDETYRVSQLTAVGFDAFLRDVFIPLFAGGVICIPGTPEVMMDSDRLVHWLHRSRVNLVHCVPSLFRIINSETLTPATFNHLRYVLLSGEPVNPHELKKWYGIFNDRIQLVNFYGPTETTMIKTFHFIQTSDIQSPRIPAGNPVRGSRVIILDKHKKICPRGITGEIYIRTAYSTFGYLDNPGLNAERFIKNPFSPDKEDIIYKTGDLGRKLENGKIEIQGRIDRQVKIRGVRIELGNIENCLLKHSKIEQSIVINRETGNDENDLCAYIMYKKHKSRENGKNPTAGELREYLSEELPAYMIPSYFIPLETLPLTPNGKINKKALPEPEIKMNREYIAPINVMEDKLAQLWAQVLGIEKNKISIDSNFFDLGGNSLKVMVLISKIHKAFNVKVPLAEMFKTPTVKGLENYIQLASEEIKITIEPVEQKEYYPLSSAQARLYIIQKLELTNTAYNIPIILQLEGAADRVRLKNAFVTLVQRHESLRVSFLEAGGKPVQKIHRHAGLKIEYYDVSQVEEKDRENRSSPMVQHFVRAFDLSKAPLMRVGLIKNGEEKYILMVDIHHIISDGLSQSILIEDFVEVYREEALSPLKIQYKDFSEWQWKELSTQRVKRQEEYWLNRFKGDIPLLDLSTDYPRQTVQRFEGHTISREIEASLTGKLKDLAIQQGVTLYMVLLTMYTILLSKYTNQNDIIVGSPVSGRSNADIELIVGMFVNVLLMRNTIEPHKRFEELLEEVQYNALQAFENQDYSIDQLAARLDIKRDAGRNPLYEAIFAMTNVENRDFTIPGLQLKPYKYSREFVKTDLRLGIMDVNDKLIVTLTYSTALFKKETAGDMLRNYMEIIEQAVTDKKIKLEDIKITHDLVTLKSNVFKEDQSEFNF